MDCGREVLSHPPSSPDLAPHDYWLFAHVKAHRRGKQFESEDNINTAVPASSRLNKDEYRAAIDRLLRRSEKCVDIVGNYIE